MFGQPKKNLEKLERILHVWNMLAPETKLGGMTKQEFEVYVTTCKQARVAVENFETQLEEVVTFRESSDEAALKKARLVINGVIGDPEMGQNSAIYAAMGYVRQDERRSGLTRKKNLTKEKSEAVNDKLREAGRLIIDEKPVN